MDGAKGQLGQARQQQAEAGLGLPVGAALGRRSRALTPGALPRCPQPRPQALLRKYITYAKQHCRPQLTQVRRRAGGLGGCAPAPAEPAAGLAALPAPGLALSFMRAPPQPPGGPRVCAVPREWGPLPHWPPRH
jgi:hypothetical protein